jgi:hypothetical protein
MFSWNRVRQRPWWFWALFALMLVGIIGRSAA